MPRASLFWWEMPRSARRLLSGRIHPLTDPIERIASLQDLANVHWDHEPADRPAADRERR